MKLLNKVDTTKENEPKYVTYFYHKFNKFVWEVTTNGTKCAPAIADELGINKDMKFGSSLPKYITDNL
jgi:hypothetical protein